MTGTNGQSKWTNARWLGLRIFLVVYDILAVNAAFFLALLTRFYVADEFHAVSRQFIDAYISYAPYYTAFCILVFACFKLYSGIWRYAGFNDLSRIFAANIICLLGHVVGTLLFVRRMPVSVYCIGTVIQLTLIVISRFAYRLFLTEKDRFLSGREAELHALVVGVSGTSQMVIKQLQNETAIRPVCALDYKNSSYGALLDGIPVVNGLDKLKGAIETYRVNLVVIASTVMPRETREQIRQLCKEENVEVQDYSGFFQSVGTGVSLKNLAECCVGEVEIVINGRHRKYADCEQAFLSEAGRYVVKSISARGDSLVVELTEKTVVQNDLNAEWVRSQEQEVGESISFF